MPKGRGADLIELPQMGNRAEDVNKTKCWNARGPMARCNGHNPGEGLHSLREAHF